MSMRSRRSEKYPLISTRSKADLVTLSAHKIGGPKGVGAVVLAGDVQGLEPLLRGGGQELGRRAGTENVAGISAFGAAAKAAMAALEVDAGRLAGLKSSLEDGLKQTPGMIVFSEAAPRLPNTTLFTRSRPKGRNRRDWLRSRRYCGIVGFGLLVRQGPAFACPGRHGAGPGTGSGSCAAQSGVVYITDRD